jgi:hypothetical protein
LFRRTQHHAYPKSDESGPHTLTRCFRQDHFNIILPSTHMSSECSLSFKLSSNNSIHILHLILISLLSETSRRCVTFHDLRDPPLAAKRCY